MAGTNSKDTGLIGWTLHQISLLVFLLFPLFISLWNTRVFRRLGDYNSGKRFPRVSLLVPARNEEANLGRCIRSLLKQEYPDFQVIVLDDGSTDSTWSILEGLAGENGRLSIIKGNPLPDGWLGKNWACHQLSNLADGELILFTDADTFHSPKTLRNAVAALLAEEADLVTVFPRQTVLSWAERLSVPVIPWSLFSFLPIAMANNSKNSRIYFANGQYMLFTRSSYTSIGGHSAVRDNVVDDLALAEKIKSANLRLLILDGTGHVSCRMYKNFHQVIDGFGKNLFAAFNYNIPVFTFIWLWLGLVFIEPPVVFLYGLLGTGINTVSMALSGCTIAASLLLWMLTYRRFKFALWQAALYPVTTAFFITIAIRSMILTLAKRTSWKGRVIRVSH